MPLSRTMISVIVAVAIVFAPVVAAWAGEAKGTDVMMAHAASHAVEGEGSSDVSGMEDCAAMMKSAADADDCPCCDKAKACPPQLCMAKCFQLLGLAQQWRPVARLMTALLEPTTPAHPPDWSDQPQPPPPRT